MIDAGQALAHSTDTYPSYALLRYLPTIERSNRGSGFIGGCASRNLG